MPVVLSVYFFWKTDPQEQITRSEEVAAVTPGASKAVLTTVDGKIIPLQPGMPHEVEVGGNIYAHHNGEAIVYADTSKTIHTGDNHLSVPRGGEFHLILSDGTEVRLNSASELRYPVTFGKEKRIVHLSGEAWFQVKKDSLRPFYVQTDAAEIRVYGTSFNVNTHPLHSVRTVLVEGSIGIRGNGQEYRLQPSQMAEFGKDGSLKSIRDVDVRPYIAWKDGLFLFEDESLEEILHTLSLWYDIDVFYASEEVKNYHFTGYMERYEQIDRILDAIRKMVDVDFKINGKTLVVSR